MKKLFGFLMILGLLSVFAVYNIIPKKIPVRATLKMKVNSFTAGRILSNPTAWPAVFNVQEKTQANDEGREGFVYDQHIYYVGKTVLNSSEILIKTENKNLPSLLQIIPLNQDSSILEWKTAITSGLNPLERIRNYREANQLEKEFNMLLGKMTKLLEDAKNAYGFQIERTKVVDTILISRKIILDRYPTTDDVYKVVNALKNYVKRHKAVQTNPPMLNVRSSDNDYQMMVALPINRQIPEESDFKIKLMVPGNILVTEVKGGTAMTAEALQAIEMYIADKNLSSPAIPFESLITDRSQQSDTSKWITKAYYPIY